MSKRERTAGRTKRAMPEPGSAAYENLVKGRAARAAANAAADPDAPTAKEKWAMLLSGTLTVKDMDDEELKRCQFRNRTGQFGGRPRNIPSHLVSAMTDETLRRAKARALNGVPAAVDFMVGLFSDDRTDENGNPLVKTADKIKVAQFLYERGFGKAEQTVTIKGEDPWAALTQDAIVTDRDLNDLLDSEPQ